MSPRTARWAAPISTCWPQVAERTDAPVIASGGVSSLDDLRAIATLTGRGVEGAIVGKALYAGRFTLPQALAAVREVDRNGSGRAGCRRLGNPGRGGASRSWRATAPIRPSPRRATTSPPKSILRSSARSSPRWKRRPESGCTARNSAARPSTRHGCGCWTRSTAPSTTPPGSPMAAILLALLHDGDPVAGLTWLPFTDQRYTAVAGGPLMKNGVAAADAGSRRAVRCAHRRRHVQRRLARPIPRTLSAWRCWKTSAGCRRGCACTAPPASTSPMSPTEYSAGQSVSAATCGITRPAWRWCGPPAASSPTWPANRGPPNRGPCWPLRPARTPRSSRSCTAQDEPEDY